MSEKVQIELSVEQAQAVNAWIKNNQMIVQNEQALRQLGETSEKASRKAKDGFDAVKNSMADAAKQALGSVSVYGVATSAISLFRKELEAIDRVNRNAFNFQNSTAVSQRNALQALGPTADLKPKQLIQMVESGSKVPVARSYAIMDAAISASGDLGARRGVETALAAGEFAPHLEADQLTEMTTGALELQKSFREYTPRQAVAQLYDALSVARQQKPGAFAKNVLPAIGQMRAYGGGQDSFSYLNSLFAAVGQRAGDAEGNISQTAMLTLGKQLAVEGRMAGLFGEGASFESQLNALRGDSPQAAALRKKLLGPLEQGYIANEHNQKAGRNSDPKLKSEAGTFVAITELLQRGDTVTKSMVNQFQTQTDGSPAEILARQEAYNEQIRQLPSQRVFEAGRVIDQANESFQNDDRRAMRGLTSEKFYSLLEESGMRAWERQGLKTGRDIVTTFTGSLPQDELEFQIRELRGREAMFRDPRQATAGMNPFASKETLAQLPALNQAQADKLDKVADGLEKILQQLKDQSNRPQPVRVESMPANQQPRQAPAAALND